MTFFNIPREQRSPLTEVDVLLTNLSLSYDEIQKNEPKESLMETHFKEMYFNEDSSGDVLVAELKKIISVNDYGISHTSELSALVISCAYCVDAIKAFDSGRLNEAWTFVFDAQYWCGVPLSQRPKRFFATEKTREISNTRSRIAREKDAKYLEKQRIFVDEMYKSGKWIDYTKAAKDITEPLISYIKKEQLPEERTRDGKEKDWYRWVYDRIRKNK